jgi:outer membrane protein OmpA-like peptidoglycan-associated protein
VRAVAVSLVLAGLLGASAAMAQDQTAASAEFMVFFDWGKPELRSDDGAVLDKAAEAWRARPGARLSLTGHTDRSGDASANRSAGLARAATVRSELEKRGVPGNAIRIASFGEDRPLVPTEDGVREVQNRRVVIAFEE